MPTFTDALDVDIGDPTKASDYDTLADNTEFNREFADVDHDFDVSTGTGYHKMMVASPQHIEVASGVIWTWGWWQDATGGWWLLVNTAEVASFSRANADFYIPNGSISDVPAS